MPVATVAEIMCHTCEMCQAKVATVFVLYGERVPRWYCQGCWEFIAPAKPIIDGHIQELQAKRDQLAADRRRSQIEIDCNQEAQ